MSLSSQDQCVTDKSCTPKVKFKKKKTPFNPNLQKENNTVDTKTTEQCAKQTPFSTENKTTKETTKPKKTKHTKKFKNTTGTNKISLNNKLNKIRKAFSFFKPHRHNIRSTNPAHLWQHARPGAASP